VVKALDLSPSGLSPREFEPRRMQANNFKERVECVAGVMVSIVAFQAVDPGSIPGPRIFGFAIDDRRPCESRCPRAIQKACLA
jgi:hypothetical protein